MRLPFFLCWVSQRVSEQLPTCLKERVVRKLKLHFNKKCTSKNLAQSLYNRGIVSGEWQHFIWDSVAFSSEFLFFILSCSGIMITFFMDVLVALWYVMNGGMVCQQWILLSPLLLVPVLLAVKDLSSCLASFPCLFLVFIGSFCLMMVLGFCLEKRAFLKERKSW